MTQNSSYRLLVKHYSYSVLHVTYKWPFVNAPQKLYSFWDKAKIKGDTRSVMKSILPVRDTSIHVKQWNQCRRCPDRMVITKDWGDCVGGRKEVKEIGEG